MIGEELGGFRSGRRFMVLDKSEWRGFERECMGRSPGDEPLIYTRRHSCGLLQLQYMNPLKDGSPFGGRAYN